MTTPARPYTVTGMSCGHCALSVREEVAALAGVDQVDVALDAASVKGDGDGGAD